MASGEPYLASVDLWAGSFAPRGWVYCYGQLLQISQNTSLYSLLGTTFGGDGVTNFGVPDLRGRVPVGTGAGVGLSEVRRGQKGGMEQVRLDTNMMPSHKHTVQQNLSVRLGALSSAAEETTPSNEVVLAQAGTKIYGKAPGDTQLGGPALSGSVTTEATGGGLPYENRQPFIGLAYILSVVGVYPSRY